MALFPSPEHRDTLLTKLRTLGISTITVEFSGSGDSGTIEDPYCLDADGKRIDMPDETLEWVDYTSTFDPNHNGNSPWVRKATIRTMSLTNVLKELTNDALEQAYIDWYNNDGGQGAFRIDFTESPPRIELDVGVNFMQVDEHNITYEDEFEDVAAKE